VVLEALTDEFGIYQVERRFGGAVAYRAVAVPEAASPGSDEHGTAA
jgi:hypothetical protein